MIKLSIIIPAYNAEPYIFELMKCLDKQMTDDVEVILIDDGSKIALMFDYPWLKSVRQKNSGISSARNRGIEMAQGEIIAFLDADDLVASNYIAYILSRADEEWDYMELSWKTMESSMYVYKLSSDNDSLPNPSACTRVFRRSFIGDVRFPEKKDACEDEHFTRHLGLKNAKHICSTELLYFYRTETPGSNSKRYLSGMCNTKRIAYYYDHVTEDMTFLIDEFRKEDEFHEVFLVTFQNDIPELEKYCQVWNPGEKGAMNAMIMRGEPNTYINLIQTPKKTQVIIYTESIDEIGGVETFCYNFCKVMSEYYDIICLYDTINDNQLRKLLKVVRCVKNNPRVPMICDTIIVNRLLSDIPQNIEYKKSVQMVHCIKQWQTWKIDQSKDVIVNVSQASKDSFGDEGKDAVVIHNLTLENTVPDSLFLVSAMRVGAEDKQFNDDRCRKFAKLLKDSGIPFIWIYFGDKQMYDEPDGMIYGGITDNIKSFMKRADYTVLLSGSEAFNYSLLESLEVQTPVIVTPLPQNKDMRIKDGVNGYIVPFEVDGFDVKKLLDIPKFKYKHDNKSIIKQWRDILGDSQPLHDYDPSAPVYVRVTKKYHDIILNKDVVPGEVFYMDRCRAELIESRGYVECM